MVVRALDYVKHCYTQEDGLKIFEVILPLLQKELHVTISFEGVKTVPSSFVNTAFINLLEHIAFDDIRKNLSFTKSTKQINEMIKTRFNFEVHERRQSD